MLKIVIYSYATHNGGDGLIPSGKYVKGREFTFKECQKQQVKGGGELSKIKKKKKKRVNMEGSSFSPLHNAQYIHITVKREPFENLGKWF